MTANLRHWDIQREFSKLDKDVLLDTHEAATALGMSSSSLIAWRQNRSDRGPQTIRFGTGTWRYRVGDLRRWIAQQSKASG